MINCVGYDNNTGYGRFYKGLSRYFNPVPKNPATNEPYLVVWHHFNETPLQHVNGPAYLYTFFETYPVDTTLINQFYKGVFVSNNWAKKVLEDSKCQVPVYVVPAFPDGGNRPIGFYKEENKPESPGRLSDTYKNVVGTIGKWEIRKGHDLIINNAGYFKDTIFVMNCDSPLTIDYSSWESWVAKTPHVFLARNHYKDLSEMVADCTSFIFPSRGEGLNMNIFEILQMKPDAHIIISDCTAHSDFIEPLNLDKFSTEPGYSAFEPPFITSGYWHEITDYVDVISKLKPKKVKRSIDFIKDNSMANAAQKIKEIIYGDHSQKS